jgi:2-desacetyl-2-hydroxyethyl bacteriochlorophyllide A dehydrogenase
MDIIQLVFPEKNKTEIEHRSISVDSSTQCIVRHESTLISPGTEGALFNGSHIGFNDPDIPWARYPIHPGYAAVGTVTEAAAACGLSVGERVIYYGPHASHGILDPSTMIWARVPEGEKPIPYLLVRFAQIAYSALAALHREPKDVLVYGAGIVGGLCAQLLETLPAVDHVSVLDLSPNRLEIAKACGIEGAHAAQDIPYTADTIIEATGSPVVINEALRHIGTRGQLVLLGSSRGTAEVNFYKMVHRKLVSIIGAHETILPVKTALEAAPSTSIPWHTQQDAVNGLMKMIQDGSLKVMPYIQTIVKPDHIQEAFENLRDHPNEFLGVCIDWS